MPDPADLKDTDIGPIATAILKAYSDLDAFFNVILNKWGVRASDVIVTGDPGLIVMNALVQWAHAQGRTIELLSLAWDDKQQEIELLQAQVDRFLRKSREMPHPEASPFSFAGAPRARGESAGPGGALESVVASETQDSGANLKRFASAICLISVSGNGTTPGFMGTGFLVGRRSVVTAYHIVEHLVESGLPGTKVRLRFNASGDVPEQELPLAAGKDWIGPHRDHEEQVGTATSAVEARLLDFALLRLAEDVAPERSMLKLPRRVPILPTGEDVFILSHPMGGPFTITFGPLLDYSQEGTRVQYRVETAAGSAGAPVLTEAGELVALHHAGVWDAGFRNKTGHGVPIWRIRAAIADAGVDPETL